MVGIAAVSEQRLFPAVAPQVIDDLVLEDAGKPGLDRGLAREAAAPFDRGEQRLLHHVFRCGLIPQLEQSVAQQIATESFGSGLVRQGSGRGSATVRVVHGWLDRTASESGI
ncbi:hypothetical protein D3C83_26690 [compost metagenome]